MDLPRAAALPLVGLTGVQLADEAVKARAGERILIAGAVGSVGRVAVFAAKRRGAQIVAGVRARQRAEAEKLDVDEIVALDDEGELDRLRPVDAIADTVNGKVMAALLDRDKVVPGGVVGTVLQPPLGAKEQPAGPHDVGASGSDRLGWNRGGRGAWGPRHSHRAAIPVEPGAGRSAHRRIRQHRKGAAGA